MSNETSSLPENVTKAIQHPAVIAVSLLFCFPVGLFFVWKHPNWDQRTKVIWTGVWAALFIILGLIGNALEDDTVEEPAPVPVTQTEDGSSSSADGVSMKEMEKLFEKLLTKIKPGMSSSQVTAILGDPHEIKTDIPYTENFELWTWREKGSEDSFIILGFQNGVLESGGTQGYDIEKGFKMGK
jgi:hypothetical protein